jgi:hypothetical protein
MTRRHRSFAGTATSLLLCTGCALYGLNPTFTKAIDYTQHPHKKEDVVLLMGETVPIDPYAQVGQVDVTRSNFQSNEDMFDAMRQLGVTYGFDGVSSIYCGPDYNAAYRCTGTAFVLK